MRVKEILKRAFITRHCILCSEPISYDLEEPFCEDCQTEWLANMDILCSSCGFDCEHCICLPEKIREIGHSMATFGVFYTPDAQTPANRIVYKLKRSYKLEVARFCAQVIYKKVVSLCAKHKINIKDFVVAYPPRRKKSFRKYGYDHARLLAKEFAKKAGIEMVELFVNTGSKEQKTLNRSQREVNAKKSYELKKNIDVKNKKIFLIDDVMTSGATLKYCANLLNSKGASKVVPITFAKDMKKHKI